MNEKKEISLKIGWLVSPSYSPNKGKVDVQFYNLNKDFMGYDDEDENDYDRD